VRKKKPQLPPFEEFQAPEGGSFGAYVCTDSMEALKLLRGGKSIQAKGPDGMLAVQSVGDRWRCYLKVSAPGKRAEMTLEHNHPGMLNAWLHIWWPWLGL
jgi:hypothetical protein